MTGTSPMTCIWLAALGMILAPAAATAASTASTSGASPDFAANAKVEVTVIDRKPVAQGAEVVLEVIKSGGRATHYWYSYRTKAGVNWVFYKGPVVQDAAESRVRRHEPIVLPPLFFNEERITFSHLQGCDAVVVTVDLDAAVPKVHEDRFVGACGSSFSSLLGGVSFQGVDELVIMDVHGRGFMKLKRDKEGTWLFADVLPYEENLRSKVSVFTPDYKLVEVILQTAAEVPDLLPPKLVEHFYLPDAMAELYMTQLERLKFIRRIFSRGPALALVPAQPSMLDIDMPSMLPAIPPFGMEDRNRLPDEVAMRMFQYDAWINHGWITVADLNLPCFATDYDKTVRGISATYELWMEYYDSRLLKSLQGVQFSGFLKLFEWEMARGTDEHEKALERRGLPARAHIQSR